MESRVCRLCHCDDGILYVDVAVERNNRGAAQRHCGLFQSVDSDQSDFRWWRWDVRGDDIFSEATLAKNGTGATQRNAAAEDKARGDAGSLGEEAKHARADESRALQQIDEALTGHSGESMVSPETARHIVTKVTDEGLIIELFDLPDARLFAPGSSEPTELMTALTAMMAEVFALVTNEIAVNGFVASQPVVVVDNQVWQLSSARADGIRRLLEAGGTLPERVQRVTGYADRMPEARDPMAARNNRIELILLRKDERRGG